MSKPQQTSGIQFPPNEEGHRSTSDTARVVFAEAAHSLEPAIAASIRGETEWHANYGQHLVDLMLAAAESNEKALMIAQGGLSAVHHAFHFLRDGKEVSLREAMSRYHAPVFGTGQIQGRGERASELEIPCGGKMLSGDALKRQVDAWAETGTMEPSAAQALLNIASSDEQRDLRDMNFALLGAGSELGPFDTLCRLGANIVAVDLPRPDIWRRLQKAAEGGAGRMLYPVSQEVGPGANSPADVAGADLLTMGPEVRTWLAELDMPFCIGGYAYLHDQEHVLVEVAMDLIMEDLAARRRDLELAFLLSPTDVFFVPEEAAEAARAGKELAPALRWWRERMKSVSKGRMYKPNVQQSVCTGRGRDYGLYDGIVPAQGPNYAMAKRIQQWRALTSRAAGYRVSANVAPITKTTSAMSRRDFAAALYGGKGYGVEVFDPPTASAVMAALLVHDLRNPRSEPLDHPHELFMDKAVHGGLWRTDLQLRSVIEIAAMRGFIPGLLGR